MDTILGAIQGNYGRDLYRLKNAIVQIALNTSQCPDDFTIPHTQVDNIFSRASGVHFELIDGCKHIGGQAIKSCKH